jgi:hypothetical protein
MLHLKPQNICNIIITPWRVYYNKKFLFYQKYYIADIIYQKFYFLVQKEKNFLKKGLKNIKKIKKL